MVRAVLRRALVRAVKHRSIAENVAALADGPRQVRHEIRPLWPEEARSFMVSLRGHRFEALFTIAFLTGLRSGELRGLRWQDVNLTHGLAGFPLLGLVGPQDIDGAVRLTEPSQSVPRSPRSTADGPATRSSDGLPMASARRGMSPTSSDGTRPTG